uniref:Uncharacterized protein n=1 Tax=Gopherus agassizii TaxID=38772 RepID=A0A452ILS7_9SAUR
MVAFPGPHITSGPGWHLRPTYTTITSTNSPDTEQMAIIKDTFVSTKGPSLPPLGLKSHFTAWGLSTRDRLTVAAADSAGSPWSFTRITSLWLGPSASSKARVVLISPLYTPTRKGPAAPGSCTSYQALTG